MGDKMGKGNVGAELIFVNGTLTLLSRDRKQAHSNTHIYGGIFFSCKEYAGYDCIKGRDIATADIPIRRVRNNKNMEIYVRRRRRR